MPWFRIKPWLMFLFGAALLIIAACQTAPAQTIPRAALEHRAELTRNARALMGLNAPVPILAAQIHQESGWRPGVTSHVGAQGMAQFMPATADWISKLFPDLATNAPYNPGWALRAVVRYDQWIYARINAANECQRWAMTLSAYNGGLGWISRDQRLASSKGLDRLVWFESVETVNAGRSAANWRENRDYPRRIIYTRQPAYIAAGWGPGVCL